MHRPALAGAKRRTWPTYAWRALRPRTLEDWLAGNGASGSRTHRAGGRTGLCRWCDRTRRRSFVHGARSGLRNNHARRWRLRRTRGDWRCGGARLNWRSRRRGRGSNRRWCRCGWCGWRSGRSSRRRRWARRRRRSNRWGRDGCRNRGLFHGYGYHWRPWRWRGHRRCSRRLRGNGRSWLCGWWRSNNGLGHNRSKRRRRRTNRWRRSGFLLLRDGLQHIAGPGDVRQINLGLDFFFAAQWASRASRRRLRFGRATDVDPHFFRFMLLQRTGMGLLLRHSDERQRVENGFAFNFQLPGEIVDSNLTHPAFRSPRFC